MRLILRAVSNPGTSGPGSAEQGISEEERVARSALGEGGSAPEAARCLGTERSQLFFFLFKGWPPSPTTYPAPAGRWNFGDATRLVL